MKYIDADCLKAEIERRRLSNRYIDTEGYESELIDIIDSLQQEQPEEMDEDFFFDEVLKVYDDNDKYPPRSEEELTMLEIIARHFYELGVNARKK